MNKERFIERLNLYLDEELSDEESEKLLEVIRRNPEYHRIYLQYCQIYNACSQLGAEFGNSRREAPAWRQKAYAFGGMAAAVALLALAAQNLSPFVSSDFGGDEMAEFQPMSVNEVAPETLLVLDVEELDAVSYKLPDSIEMVSFDLDNAFSRSVAAQPTFTAPITTRFASFEVGSPEAKQEHKWQKRFAFEKPVVASTFEHEALSAERAEAAAFSVQSASDPIDGIRSEGGYRFDADRAALAEAPVKRP